MPHQADDGQPGQLATERSARVVSSRKLLRRAGRTKAGQFLAEGPQAVREALRFHGPHEHPRAPRVRVDEVWIADDSAGRFAELIAEASRRQIPVRYATAKAVASMSDSVTPQGIVAVCGLLEADADRVLAAAPTLLAVAVDVRDPGNAGTIIRCADAAGADAVFLLGRSVDPFNGKTVRASAGSIFHLPVVRQSGVLDALAAIQTAGLRIIAAEGAAATDLHQLEDDGILTGPTAWLFGNEAHGLDPHVAAQADYRARIPMPGLAESLNLATAAAICLFASVRARR